MNNLHRELAPVSSAAWAQIEEEVARTFKRTVAARRVVDVKGPGGLALSGVGTGHQTSIASPFKGVDARQRQVLPLVVLRVPFELSREAIDDVERGANDSDWQPAKDAAIKLAYAEDRAIFDGYKAAQITGVREGTSNPVLPLPKDIADYPTVIAKALEQLRLEGVDGPYSVLLGADAYTAVAEANDQGYPILEHIGHIVSGEIIWAPAIDGGAIVSTRGGDYEMHIGQDLSIGYLDHNAETVRLYLEETFTFLMLTAEASVSVAPGAAAKAAKGK
ncbi:family 1 encapsulin nanocompartment shell protein [Pandoraea oxalativorans]|uniref:Bacteriocin n=1 Tax=Pandoraea oxalativorans TaxID=573737 RepID=A0A0E3YBZ2_9BURK|nr:family 1 encapsulin nanocompartment shell protein [Pandoraea oxalativorans]AKC70710.1 bacteriocin [Pandoraea oxalativorans]